jgi:uncharacterized integral membrane protein (TIGR00698 family)
MKLAAVRQAARFGGLAPGIAACFAVAAVSTLIGGSGGPVMLLALLLGMALAFLASSKSFGGGIDFVGRQLLRLGVALLGIRISIGEIASLGWPPLLLVVVAIGLTILVSVLLARAMGFNPLFGLLSGGATAICGASAAMALSAALPAHPLKERATLFTIVGVSTLSTVAMVAYPVVARAFGFDNHDAGLFIGATIHDVAQVVGAGYAMSAETGDTATLVKLIRVAMLAPVIVIAGLAVRSEISSPGKRVPLLPWFVVVFILLALVNSSGVLPDAVATTASEVSRWCLIAAVVAIGMKTRFKELASAGWKPVILMVLETLFLAGLVLAVILGELV